MRMWVRIITGVTLVVALAACTGEGPEGRRTGDARAQAGGPLEGGGTIEVQVRYDGEPVVKTIRINKDVEQCGNERRIEKIVVGADQGLSEAVVSVADLGSGPAVKPAEKPVLDQAGCEFHPRVLAMMPGELDILNSDGILHNIHTFSSTNSPINKAQPKFKKVMTETFSEPEIIRVQCDVHGWMEGWIVVIAHSYFGVTGEGGVVRIEHVPAGKRKVEVWHPELGSRSKAVEVKRGGTAKVVFEFTA